MANYKQSTLWQTAFNNQTDGFSDQRMELVGAYEKLRERVSLLLSQIQRELPDLTLHDITHVDALWRVASEIAGPDFPLNPAEALVLGGAFLLHDAAHCRAAYPDGLPQIRNTVEWCDAAAQRNLDPKQLEERPFDFQLVLFDTLRILHPRQARNLPFALWNDGTGNDLRLFPHDELREAYGHVMGEIAESHWFNPHELETFAGRPVTAPVCLAPASWTINRLKIAVLLRVADAAHIDAKRAPRLLLAMNHPKGVSQEHWRFQARLNQPSCDVARGELIFTSSRFPATEQAAWWLAYDAANLADKELTAADHLLRDHNQPRLAAREVAGIRSPESFARYVPTEDWYPVDTSLRISDIKSVVERFGGAKLYGNEPYLALRELLQNARDAVIACRALGALDETEGQITVKLENHNGEDWLHITDTGIGMSRYVLVQVLLDFGRSLWRDPGLRREWPGLAATGFSAVGRFGIGFFSVFMLGDHVKVTTRRHMASQEDEQTQWTLEFPQGINSRPSLRAPQSSEVLNRHGTCVSVRLLNKTKLLQIRKSSYNLFSGLSSSEDIPLTLAHVVGALAPALEIDVFTQENTDARLKTISAGDWREMNPLDLIERIAPGAAARHLLWVSNDLNIATANLSPMFGANDAMLGRCAVVGHSDSLFGLNAGAVTVGGLLGGSISGLTGIVVGEQSELLDRSFATPLIHEDGLSAWANNQSNLLRGGNQLTWKRSAALLALGAATEELLVVAHGTEDWTTKKLTDELMAMDEIWLLDDRGFQYDSDNDKVMKSDFEQYLELDPRVFVLKSGAAVNQFINKSHWPHPFFDGLPTQPGRVFEKIVNDLWPDGELTKAEGQVVGNVSGTPIRRDVQIICKTKRPAESKNGPLDTTSS